MKTPQQSLKITKKTSKNYPGRPAVRFVDHVIDGLFVVLMLFLLLCSIYIKMDSDSVYQGADPKRWVQYKPEFPDDVISFEELQEKNPDVFGWLTIYGTNIDYPLLHDPEDNFYYLTHNSLKEPDGSGSSYLACKNDPNLTDFANIIHGHHMEKHKMFGDLDRFMDAEFFEKHEFGNLYFRGQDNGIQVIAAILAEAYDKKLYNTEVQTEAEKVEFINYVYEKALLIRGVDLTNNDQSERERQLLKQGITSPITPHDTLLLFSTCNLRETNGRYIVVAKLLDHTVANPYEKTELKKKDNGERIDTFTLFNEYGALPLWVWFAILNLLILLTFILYRLSRRRDRRISRKLSTNPDKGETEHDQHEENS